MEYRTRDYSVMPRRTIQILLLLLPLSGGCRPGGAGLALDPQEIPIERERVYLKGVRFKGPQSEVALQLVKQHRDPEDGPTVDEWLNDEMSAEAGNVLFPEWKVKRIAPHRYEVRFSYTQIALDGRIERRGHAWDTDTVLGVVLHQRELRPEELSEDQRGREPGVKKPDPLNLE